MILENAEICQSDRTASRVIEGKAVVIVIDDQRLHTLNEVGTRVWELADGRTLSSIVDAVVEEFEVERNQAFEEVTSFVTRLASIGALSVRHAGEAP